MVLNSPWEVLPTEFFLDQSTMVPGRPIQGILMAGLGLRLAVLSIPVLTLSRKDIRNG